jgi:hypothetical protein
MAAGTEVTTAPVRPGGRVVISFAGPDQLWGEWLGEQLERTGFDVERRGWQPQPSADLPALIDEVLDSADRLVLVFSSAYLQAGPPLGEAWGAAVARALERREQCVPVLVGRCELPPRFWQLDPVDLYEVADEQQARRRLLARVHPTRPAGADSGLAGRPMTRYPGRRPAVWSPRIPQRNQYFTGRDPMLQRLRSLLTGDVTALIPHSLQGLGGIGKTQLAVEYAYRFAADYDLVWWVPAGHPAEARGALVELAPHLGLLDTGQLGDTVRIVLDLLRTGYPYARWLLIFDSADHPADIQPLLLPGPGQTLITSRNQDWGNRADSLDVDVYLPEESLRFLQHRAPGITEAESKALAEELGNLPLALEHAAAWLDTTGTGVGRYLELLHTQAVSLFSALKPGGYRELVATTWAVSLNQLREEQPAGADLLNLCAFFNHSPIPLDLLTQAPPPLPERLTGVLQADSQRAEALGAIGRYSLARVRPGPQGQPQLSLHPLVQTLARELVPAEQAAVYRSAVHRLLAAADPGNPLESVSFPRYAMLLPFVLSSGMPENAADPQIRQLVLNVLTYLQVRGESEVALAATEPVLTGWRAELGPLHPDVCKLVGRHVTALRDTGQPAAALQVGGELYAALLAELGPDDPLTLRATGGLAATQRRLGLFREARELDEDTLARYRRLNGPDDQETLRTAHNVAVNLRMFGQFQAALELDRDTAERTERLLGPDHLSTLFSRNNVARDLREIGDVYASVALEENVYARYVALLGLGAVDAPDAPDALRAMKNLSLSRRKAGRYEESRALAEDVLPRHRQRFGDLHPETLAAITNLANEYRLAGQHAAARGFAEEAVSGFETALGAEHPFSTGAAVNLAITLRLTGNPERAREVDELALDRLRRSLGDDHRYTLSCLVNLASDHSALGHLDRAVELGRQAVDRLREVSGQDHPYTLAAALNLALDLRANRQRDAYRELLEDTLTRYRATLGAAHPETLAAEARVRADCDIEPPPT